MWDKMLAQLEGMAPQQEDKLQRRKADNHEDGVEPPSFPKRYG
jgi:hypothetical protein